MYSLVFGHLISESLSYLTLSLDTFLESFPEREIRMFEGGKKKPLNKTVSYFYKRLWIVSLSISLSL